MSPAIKNVEPKAWLQELKTSRKLQIALACLPVLIWMLWPDSPKGAPRAAAKTGTMPLGEQQAKEIKKLPDLANLNKAGEIPADDHLYRDVFLFEGPPPPPPPPPKPLPPPPPPTPEQLAAQALAQARAAETAARPQNLRYLGFISSMTAGRLGAFMKGEEPVSVKQGDLINPKWRLVKLTDISAEFQNVKYPDLRHKIDALDTSGSRAGSAASNEF